MKGITVTSAAAAACCLAATTVSASLPSSTTGTFGIVNNHAFAGLNSRGGAVGEFACDDNTLFGKSFGCFLLACGWN